MNVKKTVKTGGRQSGRQSYKSYLVWCKHYEYDPFSESTREDYKRYQNALGTFSRLANKPKK